MADETALILTRKVFDPAETNFVPGERSMVAWITMDCIDHERDVVVPSGVDFDKFYSSNPVVLQVHDFGRWPLGKCAWVKLQKSGKWTGLYAKTIFDADEEAEKVWQKIKNRSLRGISIGFRPPDDMKPGEWGPPTRDELNRRPDWQGAERIIRRCVLLEYSVCPLPMNPRALVDAVNKGLNRPVYSLPKATKMEDENPELEDAEDKAEGEPCECGKADCEKCSGAEKPPETKAEGDEEEAPEEMDDSDDDSDDADDDSDDADPEELGPLKRYDAVDIRAKEYRGVGRVESLHTKGHVPHASNNMSASRDEPAACVKCYRAMGDGHVPTEDHVAVRVKHLSKRAEPFKSPSKGKGMAPAISHSEKSAEPEPGPLPPLIALSEDQVQQEAIRKSVEASVNRINELFGVV